VSPSHILSIFVGAEEDGVAAAALLQGTLDDLARELRPSSYLRRVGRGILGPLAPSRALSPAEGEGARNLRPIALRSTIPRAKVPLFRRPEALNEAEDRALSILSNISPKLNPGLDGEWVTRGCRLLLGFSMPNDRR